MADNIGETFTSAFRAARDTKQQGVLNEQRIKQGEFEANQREVGRQMQADVLHAFKDMTTNEVEDPAQPGLMGQPSKREKTPAEREAARLKYQNSLLSFASWKDPKAAFELKELIDSKAADKVSAQMYGVTQSILSGGGKDSFAALNKIIGAADKNEEVDLEASHYDPKSGQGVLALRNRQDPTQVRTRVLNPNVLKGMFMETVSNPDVLVKLGQSQKIFAEAGIEEQKEGAQYGLAQTRKVEQETETGRQLGLLYGTRREQEQALTDAGYPKAKVDEIISQTEMHKASAQRSRQLASAGAASGSEGGLKGANAQMRRYQVAEKLLGIQKDSEIDAGYIKQRKAMSEEGASKDMLVNLDNEYKEAKLRNKQAREISPYLMGISAHPVDPLDALVISQKVYGLDRDTREAQKLLKSKGAEMTPEELAQWQKSKLPNIEFDKDGKRYYKLGNVKVPLPTGK